MTADRKYRQVDETVRERPASSRLPTHVDPRVHVKVFHADDPEMIDDLDGCFDG